MDDGVHDGDEPGRVHHQELKRACGEHGEGREERGRDRLMKTHSEAVVCTKLLSIAGCSAVVFAFSAFCSEGG